MAKFSTNADQAKWDSLGGSSKTSFDKLLKGTASDSDLEKLSSVAAEYSELAKTIFESGLTAIEERADYLDELAQQKRIKAKKEALSGEQLDRLHKSSKKRAMKELSPELLDTIEEIETSLQDVAQEVHDATTKNTSEFTKLINFLDNKRDDDDLVPKARKAKKPKTGPSGLSPDFFNISDEDFALDFDIPSETETKSSKAKSADKKERDAALEVITSDYNKTTTGLLANKLQSTKLKTKKNAWDIDEFESTLVSKILKTFTSKELQDELANKQHYAVGTTANTTFGFNEKTDAAFLKAYRAGEATDKDISAYVTQKNKLENSGRNKSEDKKDDSESWLSKIKRMFTSDSTKGKGNSNFMDTLLAGLGLLLMSPQILTSVGEMVSKYFNWDSIKTTLGLAFDTLKDKAITIGSSIINSVKSFFGIKTEEPKQTATDKNKTMLDVGNPKPAANKLEDLKNSSATVQQMLNSNPNGPLAPKQKEILASINSQIANFDTSTNSNSASYAGSSANTTVTNSTNDSNTNAGSSNSNKTENNTNSSSNSNASSDVNSTSTSNGSIVDNSVASSAAKSSISDATNSYDAYNSNYNTQVGSMNKAPFTSGITLDNKPEINKAYADYAAANKQTVSSTPVNLGSFGFKAAINDSLNILNAGLLI